jgi:hypothetical protein
MTGWVEAEALRFLVVNQAAEREYGCSAAELLERYVDHPRREPPAKVDIAFPEPRIHTDCGSNPTTSR